MMTNIITLAFVALNLFAIVLMGVLGYAYRTALDVLARRHEELNAQTDKLSELSSEVTTLSIELQDEIQLVASAVERAREMDEIDAELDRELRRRLSEI